MERYQSKILNESVKLVFKSNNRQVVLSTIAQSGIFLPFLSGETKVQVLASRQFTFWAKIRHLDEGGPGDFVLLLHEVDSLPKIFVNDTLILLFQLPRGGFVSQAAVRDIGHEQIRIETLDPRASQRLRTLIKVNYYPISDSLFHAFKTDQTTIKRVVDYEDPQNLQSPVSCRDLLIQLSDNREFKPEGSFLGSQKPNSAIMSDISMGGCGLYVSLKVPTDEMKGKFFIYSELLVPSIERSLSIHVFSVVRHIRVGERWKCLHCMFLEPIPPDMILFS